MPHEYICLGCGEPFAPPASELRRGRGKCCSRACEASRRARPLAERFWDKVDTSGECWVWTGYKVRGYGYISMRGNNPPKRCNRVAWELTHGEIPDGMYVLHHCDNPPCVRPDHLWLGTQVDNLTDMQRKGRGKGQVNQPKALQ